MDKMDVEELPKGSTAPEIIDLAPDLTDSQPPASLDFPESSRAVHTRHQSEDLSSLTINDLRVNNGEHNRDDQIEDKGTRLHGHARHFSEDLSSLAINDLHANKGEEDCNIHEETGISRQNSVENNIYKAAEIAERFIQAIDNRVLVDTGAPIESVKDAVSKFGGILDWKERRKNVQNALDKALEDAPEYQRRAEDAEVVKSTVLTELYNTRRIIEGLKLNLERAQIEAVQAQQDLELADIRFKEVQLGIACKESAATKAEIELAKSRHESALAELEKVKDDLEQLQKEYTSLNCQKENAEAKACASSVVSQNIEKTVEDLTLELIKLKQSLMSSQAKNIIAEEQKLNAALSYQHENVNWQNELKQADEEIEKMRNETLVNKDLESKLEVATTLLVNLRNEFSTYVEGKSPQVGRLAEEVEQPMISIRVKLEEARKVLEDMREDIEKAKDEVKVLWNVAASLRADLEKENADLVALRHKEQLSSVSISSLQEEISNASYQLNVVHERTKAAGTPVELQQANEMAEQAKSKAKMASHEVAKAREEADQVKAQVNVVKLRLEAVSREILAMNTSEKIATASANALQEYKEEAPIEPLIDRVSDNYMTISLEEYDMLSKKAQDAENLAKKRVIKAVEKIKEAKDAEVRSLDQLQKQTKKIDERRLALKAAQEKANSAQYGKLTMENELRKRRAKHEQEKKDGESDYDLALIPNLKSPSRSFDATSSTSNPRTTATLSRSDTIAATTVVKEPRPRKSFFPRSIVAMFVSRKKTH